MQRLAGVFHNKVAAAGRRSGVASRKLHQRTPSRTWAARAPRVLMKNRYGKTEWSAAFMVCSCATSWIGVRTRVGHISPVLGARLRCKLNVCMALERRAPRIQKPRYAEADRPIGREGGSLRSLLWQQVHPSLQVIHPSLPAGCIQFE